MADKPHLKSLYEGVSVTDQEMHAYRAKLAASLPTARSGFSWKIPAMAVMALAAAILLFFLPARPLTQERLQDLNAWVESNPEKARVTALHYVNDPGIRGWNAAMTLTLTQKGEDAMTQAARALETEPRAEFRFIYLERLLDEADEYIFNPDKLDALIERETNPSCLRLFRSLLRFSHA